MITGLRVSQGLRSPHKGTKRASSCSSVSSAKGMATLLSMCRDNLHTHHTPVLTHTHKRTHTHTADQDPVAERCCQWGTVQIMTSPRSGRVHIWILRHLQEGEALQIGAYFCDSCGQKIERSEGVTKRLPCFLALPRSPWLSWAVLKPPQQPTDGEVRGLVCLLLFMRLFRC